MRLDLSPPRGHILRVNENTTLRIRFELNEEVTGG
jgi:hypothetical protein